MAKLKTRLDLMLDQVKCGKREITFDTEDSPGAAAKISKAARARGLHASGTQRWVLVRDLSCGRR
jgi:hypothetical protein